MQSIAHERQKAQISKLMYSVSNKWTNTLHTRLHAYFFRSALGYIYNFRSFWVQMTPSSGPICFFCCSIEFWRSSRSLFSESRYSLKVYFCKCGLSKPFHRFVSLAFYFSIPFHRFDSLALPACGVRQLSCSFFLADDCVKRRPPRSLGARLRYAFFISSRFNSDPVRPGS